MKLTVLLECGFGFVLALIMFQKSVGMSYTDH